MYIPSAQSFITAGLALTGTLTKPKEVTSGKILDYSTEKCIDSSTTSSAALFAADTKIRCSKPFLVTKSTCYTIKWKTDGVLSHTTAEVRDAGSDELVYYRDTDGDWTPEKGELVYLDFKPKTPGTKDTEVEFEVWTCS